MIKEMNLEINEQQSKLNQIEENVIAIKDTTENVYNDIEDTNIENKKRNKKVLIIVLLIVFVVVSVVTIVLVII